MTRNSIAAPTPVTPCHVRGTPHRQFARFFASPRGVARRVRASTRRRGEEIKRRAVAPSRRRVASRRVAPSRTLDTHAKKAPTLYVTYSPLVATIASDAEWCRRRGREDGTGTGNRSARRDERGRAKTRGADRGQRRDSICEWLYDQKELSNV